MHVHGERSDGREPFHGIVAKGVIVADIEADAHPLAAHALDPFDEFAEPLTLVVFDADLEAVLSSNGFGQFDLPLAAREILLEIVEGLVLFVAALRLRAAGGLGAGFRVALHDFLEGREIGWAIRQPQPVRREVHFIGLDLGAERFDIGRLE
jgi:hypothetical protein